MNDMSEQFQKAVLGLRQVLGSLGVVIERMGASGTHGPEVSEAYRLLEEAHTTTDHIVKESVNEKRKWAKRAVNGLVGNLAASLATPPVPVPPRVGGTGLGFRKTSAVLLAVGLALFIGLGSAPAIAAGPGHDKVAYTESQREKTVCPRPRPTREEWPAYSKARSRVLSKTNFLDGYTIESTLKGVFNPEMVGKEIVR